MGLIATALIYRGIVKPKD